ncbi:hypothetical protein [Rhodococcus qingshengii]|nr:hypothetical protein [Rhodococcus qingshengii]
MTPASPRTHRPRLHERLGTSVETSFILGCALAAIVIAWWAA